MTIRPIGPSAPTPQLKWLSGMGPQLLPAGPPLIITGTSLLVTFRPAVYAERLFFPGSRCRAGLLFYVGSNVCVPADGGDRPFGTKAHCPE